MICFDTQSKLYPMSKYKLDEAYQHLVGHPLCDLGNLNQTLCVQCAQRLVNFNKFRDKSLRARSLMLELVEKHELITIRHIKSISRVKHKLKSDIMKTFLGPDQFDVYIAHSDTDTQTELDATAEAVAMEHYKSDSMSVDAFQSLPTAVTSADSDADSCNGYFAYKEEYLSDDSNPSEAKHLIYPPTTTSSLCEMTAETLAPLKQEVTFACTTCLEEFSDEDMYIHHTLMHTEDIGNPDEDSVADCSPSSAVPLPAGLVTKQENEVHPTDTDNELDISILENNETTVEDLATPLMNIILQPDKPLAKLSNHINFETTTACEIFSINQIISDFGDIETKTSSESQQNQFVCDVCQKIFKRKNNLISHVKSHNFVKLLLTCKFCKYQCKDNSMLVQHTKTHTGEKPFVCKLCDYKCTQKSSLVKHIRTHTGEKPYACEICDYKCKDNSCLIRHRRIHTGEKPYACKLCDYKCGDCSSLVKHTSTHSSEKPFTCTLCDYKCKVSSRLLQHMRTHSGDNPFACKLCKYNGISNYNLVLHMRTHTGEKPYACKYCDYKSAYKAVFSRHMRSHTGEKPFVCKICNYKFTDQSNLAKHMRAHTGEKPFVCKFCGYKCTQSCNLVQHVMRYHPGEKAFVCTLCDYKCNQKSRLRMHMRTDHVQRVAGSGVG